MTTLEPDEKMREERRFGYIVGDDVWLWTKFIDGKYIINELAAGHEAVVHDLCFHFDLIKDPDTWVEGL